MGVSGSTSITSVLLEFLKLFGMLTILDSTDRTCTYPTGTHAPYLAIIQNKGFYRTGAMDRYAYTMIIRQTLDMRLRSVKQGSDACRLRTVKGYLNLRLWQILRKEGETCMEEQVCMEECSSA